MQRAPEVLVVGSGVCGLSAAIRLQEAGFVVRIVAREPALETVSAVAAAVWLPYEVEPPERVLGWAAASLAVFHELARDPASGVRIRSAVQLGGIEPPPPWFELPLTRAQPARSDELPPGNTPGLSFEAPVCEMPIHLPYLEQRFRAGGGRIELRALASLDEALERAPIVVNASGLGARELARDPALFPIRGQIVRVPLLGIERVLLDERDARRIAYVIPRSSDCILGGVAEHGRAELASDPDTTSAILERCATLEPRLAGAPILEVRVGLRPGRASVRLEAEHRPKGLVVHDYGHGGAGVTLAWGCAAEVAELVRNACA